MPAGPSASRTIRRRGRPEEADPGARGGAFADAMAAAGTETRGIDDTDAFLIGQVARIDPPIVRFDAPSAKGEAQTHTGAIHFVVDGQVRRSPGTSRDGCSRRALERIEAARRDTLKPARDSLVKSYGFGPLVPNTVLLGQAVTPADPRKHAELLSLVQRRRRNLIVVHAAEEISLLKEARRIDVWWRGHRGDLGLMLALAFLLQKDEVWTAAEIVVRRIVESEADILRATKELDGLLADARFPARVQVVSHEGDPFPAIKRHSRQADLLFLGFRSIGEDETLEDYAAYYASLSKQTDGLPPTALVNAGEEVDLHRLFAGI